MTERALRKDKRGTATTETNFIRKLATQESPTACCRQPEDGYFHWICCVPTPPDWHKTLQLHIIASLKTVGFPNPTLRIYTGDSFVKNKFLKQVSKSVSLLFVSRLACIRGNFRSIFPLFRQYNFLESRNWYHLAYREWIGILAKGTRAPYWGDGCLWASACLLQDRCPCLSSLSIHTPGWCNLSF